MDFYFERRASASALWARRTALFSAALLITATAGHRYGAVDTVPYFWLLCVVFGLALLSLVLAGVGFFRLWTNGDRGGRASTRAVIVAIVVLLPFGFAAWQAYMLPRLTDVSTDTENPPRFLTAQARRPADANPIVAPRPEAILLQIGAYPAVTGRRYSQPVDRLGEIMDAVIAQLGWESVARRDSVAEDGVAETELIARSPVVGLVSDVAVRVVDEGESTYVDMRSASRYGPHDLGDNAAKILRFFAALDAEVALRNMPVDVERE